MGVLRFRRAVVAEVAEVAVAEVSTRAGPPLRRESSKDRPDYTRRGSGLPVLMTGQIVGAGPRACPRWIASLLADRAGPRAYPYATLEQVMNRVCNDEGHLDSI